jgi:hypothetical protein
MDGELQFLLRFVVAFPALGFEEVLLEDKTALS